MLNTTKIVSLVAGGSLIFSLLAVPAFAEDSTLSISGNGSNSDNKASVSNDTSSTVVQNNTAKVSNSVTSDSNTGDNSASGNTGGSVGITTGNSSTTTNVSTATNLNSASTNNCECSKGKETVSITGNGSNSDNHARIDNNNDTSVFQDNSAKIYNKVYNNSNTGYNSADNNTGPTNGSSSVSIGTGNATQTTTVKNAANANIVSPASSGSSSGGSLDATISGNGAGSYNKIRLNNDNNQTVVQSNDAYISNKVKNWGNTGYNNADNNTGSSVAITTGGATATTTIGNATNFNSADLDCGCVNTTSATISGNGAHSYNKIYADSSNDSSIYQGGHGAGNDSNIKNRVYNDGFTGDNDASLNTAALSGSGMDRITTGSSNSTTTVSSSGNVNMVGPDAPNLSLLNGKNLTFGFDLQGLMGMFGLV